MTVRRALVLALLAAVLAAVDLARPLPQTWFAPRGSRVVRDRDGVVLAERRTPERGRETWTPVAGVAPHVVDALVASEDRRLGRHPGVDPVAVVRAAWASLRAGRVVQGGSTLAQQTARILAGRPPGLLGKAVEAWRAVRLTAHLDRDALVETYLNRAYFGQGATGIDAAARTTFDESPASLSVAEAALLVGLLPAPERLHPRVDLAAATRARDRVLDRMVATGRLDPGAADEARAEPVELRSRSREGLAPHLVVRVLDEAPAALEIRTTLDRDLQREVEALVARQLRALEGRSVDHAAVLVVHVPTSEVLAYVGSGGFDRPAGQVDGARAARSPGSAVKPFVYALAVEQGWRPSDVLHDVERRYATTHGTWVPENYTRRHLGPVSLREALASSLNVPTVALLEQVGVDEVQRRLAPLGFDWDGPATRYGLGLGLGDAEVSLWDLTAAYAGLARGGLWMPLRVRSDAPASEPVRFLDPGVAAVIADVLADPVARAPGFGRDGPLERPYRASAKTGTSTGYRDNWTVGFAGEFAVGVWVGNFDGRPMGDVTGVTGAAPLWAAVMDRVTGARVPAQDPPPGYERRAACALSGGSPGPRCPEHVADWVAAGSADRAPCAWHLDGCRVAWPPELAAWAADHDRTPSFPGPSPGMASAGCPSVGPAGIAWPVAGTVVYVDPRIPREAQRLPLRAAAPAGARSATWTVDGEPVATAVDPAAPALWQPRSAGLHVVALEVDGRPAGTVAVDVRGHPSVGGSAPRSPRDPSSPR